MIGAPDQKERRVSDSSTDVKISTYSTPADLYQALARVFPEQSNNGTRWVTFTHDGISLTFFAPREES